MDTLTQPTLEELLERGRQELAAERKEAQEEQDRQLRNAIRLADQEWQALTEAAHKEIPAALHPYLQFFRDAEQPADRPNQYGENVWIRLPGSVPVSASFVRWNDPERWTATAKHDSNVYYKVPRPTAGRAGFDHYEETIWENEPGWSFDNVKAYPLEKALAMAEERGRTFQEYQVLYEAELSAAQAELARAQERRARREAASAASRATEEPAPEPELAAAVRAVVLQVLSEREI